MIWFWQVFKLLKLFVSFIKAVSKILDKSDDSDKDANIEEEMEKTEQEIAAIEEAVKEKPEKPAKKRLFFKKEPQEKPDEVTEITEIIEVVEEPQLPAKKDTNPLSYVAGTIGFAAGFVGVVYLINKFFIPTYSKVPKALTGELKHLKVDEGVLAYYKEGSGPPLVLIHGINPGGSSHEMEVIFNHYRLNRTVYSIDLLGFGQSQRPDIEYTPEIYIQHICEFINHVKLLHDCKPDVFALGLSTEYIVSIADQEADLINKAVLISPTGLERTVSKASWACHKAAVNLFRLPVLGQGLFNLITSKTFLKKYLTSRIFVEPRNLSYLPFQPYYHTTHVTGAKNAPSY
jgi:hypothetical protein